MTSPLGGLILSASMAILTSPAVPEAEMLLAASTPHTQERTEETLDEVRRAIQEHDEGCKGRGARERVRVFSVEGHPGVYLAICEEAWWGHFVVFGCHRGTVEWIADVAERPDELGIDSARPMTLRGFRAPLIEVFGTTQGGNGNLHVYELHGHSLKRVLRTRAVDSHADETLIRGGRLTVMYRDDNGDGLTDVVLSGIVDVYNNGETVLGSRNCRKVFHWDEKKHSFIEDRSQRVACHPNEDAGIE